uniref:Uncharacterized protein n=1 Tax=Heterorhabditis bacteriophora TaxID=37862 RepID=A0A1I7X6P8_HETBA
MNDLNSDMMGIESQCDNLQLNSNVLYDESEIPEKVFTFDEEAFLQWIEGAKGPREYIYIYIYIF